MKTMKKTDTFRVEGKNLDVAIAEKRAYDFLVRQQEAKQWMEEMLNEKIPGATSDFVPANRDGLFLCRLANVFTNNSIKKIHQVKSGNVLEFMAIDNLNSFLRASKSVGFPEYHFFGIPDIWEKKNIVKVVSCIHALAHYLEKIGNFVKIKDLSKVGLKFNDDEIKKTKDELKGLEDFLPPPPSVSIEETKEVEDEDDEDLELASPDECTVEGEGCSKAEAGVVNTFTIVSKDSLGNPLDHGDEVFQVLLFKKDDKKTKIVGTIKDLKNGKYIVSYTPEKAGDYEMEIYLLDVQSGDDEETIDEHKLLLKGCPMAVSVSSNKNSDAKKCVLDGVGTTASTAGTETKFTINSFDKFGNKGLGGEEFKVKLTQGDLVVDGAVKDLGNGQYEVSYTCPKTGAYDLDVKVGENSIGDGKKVTVKDAGVSKPDLCELDGLKSTSIKAGETLDFDVVAKDVHGNVRESGGEKFSAVLIDKSTGDKINIDLTDSQNGRYAGSYKATKSGDFELVVSLDGNNIKDCPIAVHVDDTGVSDATKTTCVLPNLSKVKAGELQTLIVESRDQYGNLLGKGGETYTARIANKTKKELYEDKATTKDLGNGKYEIQFTLEDEGEYVLEVLSCKGDDVVNINGFPVEHIFVVESGVTEPKNCVPTGDGLKEAYSKKQAEFTLKSFDKYGNARTTGGDEVKVVFTEKKKGTQFTPEVKDLNNGSYQITYTTEVPVDSEFDTEILVNGVNICADKPNILKVKGLKIRDIGEDQLSDIADYDLLNSLINLFKEESAESFVGKIQELREKMITQIRKNFELESAVKAIEKKIELVIDNRIKAEEAAQTVGRFGRAKPTKKDEKKKMGGEDNNQASYSHLFYLLQTDPRYLGHCLFMVPSEKVDGFLETVILTLYGYAFSPREEYLILNLFKQTLQLEVERDNKKCGSFLNNNPVLPKMVMTYGRRLQGKTYLQKVLYDKIIDPIIQKRGLDLEINAVKMLKTYLSDQEVATGEKNTRIDVKNLTYEVAMKEDHISKEINSRFQQLCDLCSMVLQGMSDNVNEMPYGLRYVCKLLDRMLKVKHPESTETDRNSVISNIVYYRFMNPALVSPDGFELTKKAIAATMRTNLLLISKVMTNLSSNAVFDKKLEEHMCIMNDWLKKNESTYNEFIRKLINVPDPEETLGVDEFMELTQKTNPSITIHLNEMYSTHSLLLKYLHKLAPEKDDPLNILLNKEHMTKAPDELPKEQDDEIKLPLLNGFAATSSTKTSPEQLYEQTKEAFRKILKSLPAEAIGSNVEETLEMAKQWATKKGDETAKLVLLYAQQVVDALPALVEAKKISKDNKYRQIILDITKEIQNLKVVLAKQKKEFERLQDSYASLQGHQKYLEEKVADFEEYIKKTMEAEFLPKSGKSSKASKKHNFTFAQLEKKGVISELKVMKSQRNQVKFTISMPNPGIFQVDAKVLNAVVSTMEIKLDDLLQKKSRGVEKMEFEHVILDVNMTLHVMNKLFVA